MKKIILNAKLDKQREKKYKTQKSTDKKNTSKMSDLLKSAMGYFNAGPTTTTTTTTSSPSDNDFVGQIVEVGSLKLRVKRVIAEG